MSEKITPNTPALKPPPGVTSNFDNPEGTLKVLMIWMNSLSLIFPFIFVSIRIMTNYFVNKRWLIEDTFSVLALVGVFSWIGLGIHPEFSFQITRHMWDVRAIDIPMVIYYANVLSIMYCPCMLVAKLAIIFQIKRVFTTSKRTGTWWAVWITLVATVIFYTVAMFITIFQCLPRRKIWDPEVPGHCLNPGRILIPLATVNCLSSFATLLLPIWSACRLNLHRRHRIQVIIIFGSGLTACILGAIGIYYRVNLNHTEDFTYAISQCGIFGVAEIAVVTCVGCAASVPRFYRFVTGGTNKASELDGFDPAKLSTSSKGSDGSSEKKKSKDKRPRVLNSMAKYLGAGESQLIQSTRDRDGEQKSTSETQVDERSWEEIKEDEETGHATQQEAGPSSK